MDPNANLTEQEQLLHLRRLYRRGSHYREERQALVERLTELREALLDWLRSGGFEPDWSACPHAARYFGK